MVSGMDRFLADFADDTKPTVKENTLDKDIRNVQSKFLLLMKTHSFLAKNDFYKSIKTQLDSKRNLTISQARAVKDSLKQWENKEILLYLKLVNKYPFIKETDKINAYTVLINGQLLTESQLKWVNNSIREIKSKKYIFDGYFKENPSFKYNLQIYQLLVENKNVPDNELGYIVSQLKDKFIIEELKTKRLYIRKYMRNNKNSSGFHGQLYHFLNKGIPLTGKQFEKIEEQTNINKEDLKKEIPVTEPSRKKVRSY